MSSINEHAVFWTQDGHPHRELEEEIVGRMITHLEAQVFEEKKWHWDRLHHIKTNIVPYILDMAHRDLEFNETYEEELKRMVKELVPPYGLRRMVLTRVLATDPWLVAGGPALPNVGDVAVAACGGCSFGGR
ncbi:hypothetical protein [Absidia glauca]|uniref:Uncharacterized protein n=1 Tax=Absidia glauca TaxID=4829 RepID=A0A168LJB8_ABSGL|nr:hypothetical protein [Absidia glauca]